MLLCLLEPGATEAQSPEIESLLEQVQVHAVIRGPDDSLYLAGSTDSTNLPNTQGTMQPTLVGCGESAVMNISSCRDAFVARLNLADREVLFTTYLGGSDSDGAVDLVLDGQGNIYLLGETSSEDFPTTATAVQESLAGRGPPGLPGDLFVAKISPLGGALLYSSYLGGSDSDSAGRMQVRSDGHIYVTSSTDSSDFPVTPGAYLTVRPEPTFVDFLLGGILPASTATRIDPDSESLIYSTFLDRRIDDFALDDRGAALLAGPAHLLLFPRLFFSTKGEVMPKGQTTSLDAFVVRLSPDGAAIESEIRFAGSGTESVTDIELDEESNIWITGFSSSNDLPLINPLLGISRPTGFVTKLAPDGDLLFASHLPGTGDNLILNGPNEAVVLGSAVRANVPTTSNAYLSGPCSASFAMHLRDNADLLYSSYLPNAKRTAHFRSGGNAEFTGVRLGRIESIRTTDTPPSFACLTHGATTALIPSGLTTYLSGLPAAQVPALAPGEFVDLHGFGWGPEEVIPLGLDEDGRVAASLGGIRVLFNGTPAPLVFVQNRLIRAVVPFLQSADTTMTVEVESAGERMPQLSATWMPSSLGIFTLDGLGDGPAAVLNEDGTLNSGGNPTAKGSVVAIFATGGGMTHPPSADGVITPIEGPYPRLDLPVHVFFAAPTSLFSTEPLPQGEILYAGAAPGFVAGVIQVNTRIPQDAPSGPDVRLHLRVGANAVLNGLNAPRNAPTIGIE